MNLGYDPKFKINLDSNVSNIILYDDDDDYSNQLNDNDYETLKKNATTNINIQHQTQQPLAEFNHTNSFYLESQKIQQETGYDYRDRIHYINCMFAHQNEVSARKPWNRLAACYQGSDIIHCEFFFQSDRLTCSVDRHNPVYLKPGKLYDFNMFQRKYTCIQLGMSFKDYDNIYQFCMRERGKPFDQNGLKLYIFRGLFTKVEGENWICSRLMSASMRDTGILPPSINVFDITPNELYMLLRTLNPTTNKIVKEKNYFTNYPYWTQINHF